LAQIERGQCALISRNDNVFERFRDLAAALPDDLKGVVDCVLDGEITVLDDTGASRFNDLMHSRSTPIFAA
jgi:ATP-dependent DNA ligase